MDSWQELHEHFLALATEEDRLVRQTAPPQWMCALYEYNDALPYGRWTIARFISESLCERFEMRATQAGIALGLPTGAKPMDYWLHRLLEYLRDNNSQYIRGSQRLIDHLCEASANYCARLSVEALEAEHAGTAPIQLPKAPSTIAEYVQIQQRQREARLVAEAKVEARKKFAAEQELERLRAASTPPVGSPITVVQESVASQLNRLRDECGISIEELAYQVGLHARSVQRHLASETAVRSTHLSAYNRVFSKLLKRNIVIRKMP